MKFILIVLALLVVEVALSLTLGGNLKLEKENKIKPEVEYGPDTMPSDDSKRERRNAVVKKSPAYGPDSMPSDGSKRERRNAVVKKPSTS
mmetsp:Transcript_2056/g.2109  ORF Transcript_2056/g.2109 Transcript_2056/m.2109 type:complete len:90 (+) Transcript_2056:20-289(+)